MKSAGGGGGSHYHSYNSISLVKAKSQSFPNAGEYALQHDNYQCKKPASSIVVMITNENRIEAWDLETDQVHWTINISFSLGTSTHT